MKIEGAFLRSKVARRVVLFFILSALIPLGVGAVLALGHVQSLLVEQGHARLAQISEGYAAYLYDRLTAASERTHEIAARVAAPEHEDLDLRASEVQHPQRRDSGKFSGQ